jgi:ABC-2 type transport system ATP-binding protein
VIEARDITVQDGSAPPALDRVSFAADAAEIYGLLGAPGSGKSALVNVLLGLTKLTSGRLLIGGRDVTATSFGARTTTAFVGQHSALCPMLSSRRNVAFFASVATGKRTWSRSLIDAAMRRAGIAEKHFDRPLHELNRTLEVLLLLAVAFLRDVQAVVVDEPTAGVDPQGVAEIQDCLEEFKRDRKTVLVVSGDVAFVSQVADRVGMLLRGRKVAERVRSELLGRSLTDVQLEYAMHLS